MTNVKSTLSLTTEQNAVDYLERASEFFAQTTTDEMAWKWVAISLHGALYGFAVAACKGTDWTSVTRQTKGERPVRKVISLDEALKRCQNPAHMKMLIHSQPLVLTESQRRSVRMLTKFLRDRFEHYPPGVWDIDVSGMPQIASDVLDVVRFLAVDTGSYVDVSSGLVDEVVHRAKAFISRKFATG